MASTYSTSLKLELIGNGEQSGVWGTTTNKNMGSLLEQAITGVQTITMANANYTLTNLNGTLDEARNAVLVLTGTNSAVRQVIAPLVEKLYVVTNSTTGGYAVTIGGATGSIISIPNGTTCQVYCDGTNFFQSNTGSAGNFTVNGDLGVTGVATFAAGTVSAPAITTTGDTNTGIFFPAADTIAFTEGGAEAMRITSTGRVGIGTVSPTASLQVNNAPSLAAGITVENTSSGVGTDANLTLRSNVGFASKYYNFIDSVDQTSGNSQWAIGYGADANTLIFSTGSSRTERMRISSTGKVLINTTTIPTNSFLYVNGAIGQNIDSSNPADNNNKSGTYLQGNNVIVSHDNTEPTGFFMTYQFGGAIAGYIAGISAGAGVQYISVSDYRLKEDIAPMTGALDKIQALKPVTYTWKANGEKADGFLAHELQEVLPNAVSGEKDAVNEDGSIKAQGIDTSYIVATLTAAIQEQQATIKALTARIETLEKK